MNIYVFKGLPGVGKSTLATSLAQELNTIVINKDDINDIVFSQFGANKESSEVVYKIIHYLVELHSDTLENVVIDCSLARKDNYLDFLKVAKGVHAELVAIEVYLDSYDRVEERLTQRTDMPEHRIKSIKDIKKQGLQYEEYDIDGLIRIENSGSIEDSLKELKRKIAA